MTSASRLLAPLSHPGTCRTRGLGPDPGAPSGAAEREDFGRRSTTAWLRSDTGSNLLLLIAAVLTTLVLFAVDTARNEPRTFVAMLVVGALAVVRDSLWSADGTKSCRC